MLRNRNEEKLPMRVRFRRWKKSLKQQAGYLGWRYAIRQELRHLPLIGFAMDKWHMLKCNSKRYDMVKAYGLSRWYYYDSMERLIGSVFGVLVEFVESNFEFKGNEIIDTRIDWTSDERHADAKKELIRIYKWWKEDWQNRKDPIMDAPVHDDDDQTSLVPCEFDEDGDPMFYEFKSNFSKEFEEQVKKSHEWEARMEQELEDNMVSIVKLRYFM